MPAKDAKNGRGRPKLKDAGVSVSGRIPRSVVAKMDKKAEQLGVTRSQALAYAVIEWVR